MRSIALLSILCLLVTGCIETDDGSIKVDQPYSFGTMPGAKTGAAFMTLTNKGAEEDSLIAAKSSVAEITEVHQNLIDPDDGKMMMRRIKSIALPINETVKLEPTGYHIMFIDLKQALGIGETIPVQLVFEKSGTKTINVEVIAPGTKP